MTVTASKNQILLARLVVVLVVAFIVLGAILHGFSPEARQRFWADLVGRPGGPMSFRIFLQPIMAVIAALTDGIKDAKSGRSPYFWTVLTNPTERADRLREGLVSTARIILLALAMDVIYQVVALKAFYPVEAVVVAIVLGFVPYFVLRGPIARVARWYRGDATGEIR
jgi:hypothetical protein